MKHSEKENAAFKHSKQIVSHCAVQYILKINNKDGKFQGRGSAYLYKEFIKKKEIYRNGQTFKTPIINSGEPLWNVGGA